MKRTVITDLGAIVAISAASLFQFLEHALPFSIAVVVGVLTIWEKWQVIQSQRQAKKNAPRQEGGSQA
jgi:hypothetical protein